MGCIDVSCFFLSNEKRRRPSTRHMCVYNSNLPGHPNHDEFIGRSAETELLITPDFTEMKKSKSVL